MVFPADARQACQKIAYFPRFAPGRKGLPETNDLAYLDPLPVTKKKMLITMELGDNTTLTILVNHSPVQVMCRTGGWTIIQSRCQRYTTFFIITKARAKQTGVCRLFHICMQGHEPTL
jgi:hypothetical protein